MKRFVFMAIAAAGFVAVVSAMEYYPRPTGAPGRSEKLEQAVIEFVDQDQLALETIEKLTPGASPSGPLMQFAVRSLGPTWENPDGYAPSDIAAWQVQILDSRGDKVSFIQGKDQTLPPVLSWSGLSGNGEPFPSGFYTARLVWTDRANKVYATQKVSFNLFSQLKIPAFAELNLDLRFIEEYALI